MTEYIFIVVCTFYNNSFTGQTIEQTYEKYYSKTALVERLKGDDRGLCEAYQATPMLYEVTIKKEHRKKEIDEVVEIGREVIFKGTP